MPMHFSAASHVDRIAAAGRHATPLASVTRETAGYVIGPQDQLSERAGATTSRGRPLVGYDRVLTPDMRAFTRRSRTFLVERNAESGQRRG